MTLLDEQFQKTPLPGNTTPLTPQKNRPARIEAMLKVYLQTLTETLVQIITVAILAWSILVAPTDAFILKASEHARVLEWRYLVAVTFTTLYVMTVCYDTRKWITTLHTTAVCFIGFITPLYFLEASGYAFEYTYIVYTTPIGLIIVPSTLYRRIALNVVLYASIMTGSVLAVGVDFKRLVYLGVILLGIHILNVAIGHFCYYRLNRKSFLQHRKLGQQHQTVQYHATTDQLTGLANRHHFMNVADQMIEQAYRQKTALSVILFDIDHFKQINDKHGHITGDDVLRVIGKIIEDGTRQTDIAGRYGGEEFAVVAPDTPLEEARGMARRISEQFADRTFSGRGESFSVTVCAGVAEMQSYTTVNDLIDQADDALYEAKNAGRNCIRAYSNKTRTIQ